VAATLIIIGAAIAEEFCFTAPMGGYLIVNHNDDYHTDAEQDNKGCQLQHF